MQSPTLHVSPPEPGPLRLPFSRLPLTLEPDRALLTYSLLSALLTGPAFPLVMVALWFRFRTLRYELDDEGITMRWGILFRREISLTYARVQDIHLSSNVVERWLGLTKIQVQTASGSAGAEMTIQGVRESEALRDFLYSRMRGTRDHEEAAPTAAADAAPAGELAATLREIAAEVRLLRRSLPAPRPDGRPDE